MFVATIYSKLCTILSNFGYLSNLMSQYVLYSKDGKCPFFIASLSQVRPLFSFFYTLLLVPSINNFASTNLASSAPFDAPFKIKASSWSSDNSSSSSTLYSSYIIYNLIHIFTW